MTNGFKIVVSSLVANLCPTLTTPWAVAHQAPLSMGFSRQEYWGGLTFPPPGDLPDPGIKLVSPALDTQHPIASDPLQYSGLENSKDCTVAKSRT